MHLDQVPGTVDLRQGQPVQLACCGAEPLRRGEELPQSGWMVDARGVLQEELGGDRLGEKNAHKLNRCSASGVRSVVDIAQVPEMWAGRSGSPGCSLSSW